MHVVAAHRTWAAALPDDAANSDSPKLATRYHILLKNLIEYRDISSVPLLKSLLIPPENKHTARVILSSVLALTNATQRVHDPFVLEFGKVARGFMNDPWGDDRHNLREPAMLLGVRALDDSAAQIPLLQAGLRDRSQYVQLAAAREAAALGLSSMAPEILRNYRGSRRNLQPHFCNALTALNVKCNEQGASP